MNILITGTSSGIGYGLATTYLQQGHSVWGISRRVNKSLLKNAKYTHTKLNLTEFTEIEKIISPIVTREKSLDLVILNAGILGEIQLMSESNVEHLKEVMNINVWANKILLDTLFKHNVQIKQVIGMSSKASLRCSLGWGAYSISKAALNMLMNAYAKEQPNTHFTAFAPGLVDSEIQDKIYSIKETDKYPSCKTLQEARYTQAMPDAITIAPVLIEGFKTVLSLPSGGFWDVRDREHILFE